MTMSDFRYFVISSGGERCDGYEQRRAAEAVALEYGDGAHLVDTVAAVYAVLKGARRLIDASAAKLMATMVMDHIAAQKSVAPKIEGRIARH